MEQGTKRIRRSKEEIKGAKVAKLQEEITKYEDKIAECKKKIEELNAPSANLRDVTAKIKELGLSPDDVMKAIEKMGKK